MRKYKNTLTNEEIEAIADHEKEARYFAELDGRWYPDYWDASKQYHLRLIEKFLEPPVWAFWRRKSILVVIEYDNLENEEVAIQFGERRAAMLKRFYKLTTIFYARWVADVTPDARLHERPRPMPDTNHYGLR